jgi:cell division protein FtsN
MYLVAIAWMYVVAMMAAAEASSSTGSLLGAFFTLLLYGVLPLGIVMYLLNTPARRRALRAARQAADSNKSAGPPDPDQGGHAAGEAIAPVRKEP